MALFPTLGTVGRTDLHTHPTTTLGFGQLLKKFWEHGKEKEAEYRGRSSGGWRECTRGLVLGSGGPCWKDVSRTCVRFNCVLAFAPLNILIDVQRTLMASEDEEHPELLFKGWPNECASSVTTVLKQPQTTLNPRVWLYSDNYVRLLEVKIWTACQLDISQNVILYWIVFLQPLRNVKAASNS